jgi:hypothetical protein
MHIERRHQNCNEHIEYVLRKNKPVLIFQWNFKSAKGL